MRSVATQEFRGRWNEPGIVSYAQNAEDVRLWRVFSTKPGGFYVDVGAGDPMLHSVTKLFYDAGWSGLNIEPGPNHLALVEARPRDVNLAVAVSTKEGLADFWISSPDSGLSSFVAPDEQLVPEGFSFEKTRVRCVRLDTLIEEHGAGREIDFLKIDVEGAEGDVLRTFNPEVIRPTVILVEAISPIENRRNHHEWETLLTDHGYHFAAFDGINRFYVPEERADLIDPLGYPISVLDRYESIDVVAERFRAQQELERDNATLRDAVRQRDLANTALAARNDDLAARNDRMAAELSTIKTTVSWRVTRPLRAIRRSQLVRTRPRGPASGTVATLSPGTTRVRRPPGGSDADPVFEVTGVAANEILSRCAALRAERAGASRSLREVKAALAALRRAPSRVRRWRWHSPK
jgi:FkbM family methyltransferase